MGRDFIALFGLRGVFLLSLSFSMTCVVLGYAPPARNPCQAQAPPYARSVLLWRAGERDFQAIDGSACRSTVQTLVMEVLVSRTLMLGQPIYDQRL